MFYIGNFNIIDNSFIAFGEKLFVDLTTNQKFSVNLYYDDLRNASYHFAYLDEEGNTCYT